MRPSVTYICACIGGVIHTSFDHFHRKCYSRAGLGPEYLLQLVLLVDSVAFWYTHDRFSLRSMLFTPSAIIYSCVFFRAFYRAFLTLGLLLLFPI